jgi:DUF3071 family protein
MRALRVVGITEGGGELSVVLEDSARQERFTVPADEQLRAAARGDLTRLGQIAIELESQLRPREIQARIRAGASVDQVAAAAGVPSQKIERFAYPVLLERSRTAEVAQRAHPVRADGPDTRVLADVVAHTFGLRGQEYTSAEWDSWKGDDGRWVVALSWRAGRSDNRALWTFQPGAHGGTVTAIDEHAHDLVEGLPARPLRTVGPVIDISRPAEQQAPAPPEEGHELRAAASDIAARREASDWSRVAPEPRRPEPRRQAARQETTEAAARPARPDEPATEWPAAQRQSEERAPIERSGDRRADDDHADDRVRAGAGPTRATSGPGDPERNKARPNEQAVASRPTAEPAPTRPAEAEAAAVPSARSPEPEPADAPAPDAATAAKPTDPPQQAEPTTPASKRSRKGKPVMPSWDEVLLGVRSQR